MFEQDFVKLQSACETFLVSVRRRGGVLTEREARDARRATQFLRFALESRDRRAIVAAERLLRALDGHVAEARGPGSSEASDRFVGELIRRITSEFSRGRLLVQIRTNEQLESPLPDPPAAAATASSAPAASSAPPPSPSPRESSGAQVEERFFGGL